jgi:carbon storage regulator
MLVITRKENEMLLIGGDIKVIVLEVRGKQVRLGIEAPAGILIVRGEIEAQGSLEKGQKEN